jgi:signal transduction histidine kinase
VGDLIRTQRRVESTVTALGQLAAGEVMRPEDRVTFDVTELFDRVAQEDARTHPTVRIATRGDQPLLMTGWPDGIRLAADNLVRNALTHGRATEIELSAALVENADRRQIELCVDDNGVGLPPTDRDRVLHRFERGPPGSAVPASGSPSSHSRPRCTAAPSPSPTAHSAASAQP